MGHEYSKRDRRAVKLGAMNARALLVFSYPMIYKRLSDFDIARVQYVLDAAVVNPDVQRQYNEAMRNAITSQIGNQVNFDPRVVSRGDKVLRTIMHTTKDDLHIRLDFKQFIAPDAFLPKSNNPDELEYLTKVKHALETYGIWLNLDAHWYNTKEHALNQDPKQFRVWLSYGKNGRAIDAPLGYIGRDEILAAVSVGKGLYDEVYRGPVAQQFDKLVTKVKINLEIGQDEHMRLLKKNHNAATGVVPVVEFLGSSGDLPEFSIWEPPHDLLTKALNLRNQGNILDAPPFLVLALLRAKNNLALLMKYEEETTQGAARSVKILSATKTISEDILLAVSIYQGAVVLTQKGGQYLAARTAAKASSTAAEDSINKLAQDYLDWYIKKNGKFGAEIARELPSVRNVVVPGAVGKVQRGFGREGLGPGEFF